MLRKILEFYFKSYSIYYYKINKNDVNANLNFQNLKFPQLTYKICTIEDYSYFVSAISEDSKLEIIYNRLLKPYEYKGFIIVDEEDSALVYYSWICLKKQYYCKEMNQYITLKKNMALFEDDYTFEKYRQKGLHTFMMYKRIEYCIDNNIHKIFIIIQSNNYIAKKTIKKFNFKRKWNIPIYYRKGAIEYTINKIKLWILK